MKLRRLISVLALLALVPAVWAEVAAISGTVRDDQGRPVSNATVRVTNRARVEKAEAVTNAGGAYAINVAGRGWASGPNYRIEANSPDGQVTLTRELVLADGPNSVNELRLNTKPVVASAAPVLVAPGDERWYITLGAGATKLDRPTVAYGRKSQFSGSNTEGVGFRDWAPEANALVGYKLNKTQSIEVGYRGVFIDTKESGRASEINVPTIDLNQMGISIPSTGAGHVKQQLEADWHEADVMFRHVFIDKEKWSLTGKAGIFGGSFDQTFKSNITTDDFFSDDVKEELDDKYIGPMIGAELKYRFNDKFWAGLGLGVGAAFGDAELNGKEAIGQLDQAGILTAASYPRIQDTREYASLRFDGTLTVGWDPCEWAGVTLGYRYGYWSNVPGIENGPCTSGNDMIGAPVFARSKAHLVGQEMMTHSITAAFTIKFR